MNTIVKRYGDFLALDHFSISVNHGEIYGLLGPNGCRKTTAINCLLSLLTYEKGQVEIFGQKMTATNSIKVKIIVQLKQNQKVNQFGSVFTSFIDYVTLMTFIKVIGTVHLATNRPEIVKRDRLSKMSQLQRTGQLWAASLVGLCVID